MIGIGRWQVADQSGFSALSPTPRDTLATLLAFGPDGVGRHALAEALFPDQTLASSGAKMRVRASRLRSLLPVGAMPDAGATGRYRLALDPSQVDLWALLDLASDRDGVVDEDDLIWALHGEPYHGVDLPATLAHAQHSTKRAQRAIAIRFCQSRPTSLSFQASERLLWLLGQDPYDEELAVEIAAALASGNRGEAAVRALADFGSVFEADLDTRPVQVDQMLEQLEARIRPAVTLVPASSPFPVGLRRLEGRSCLGRDTEIDLLINNGGLVVGPRGGGKSQLLAEIADRELRSGNDVTFLTGYEHDHVELSPFLAALPELADVAWPADKVDSDEATNDRITIARLWTKTLELLQPSAGWKRRHILIDDAQWLNGESAALVQLLLRSAPTQPFTMTVAGRSDQHSIEWLRLRKEMVGLSFTQVELGGLDLLAIEGLIAEMHPGATEQSRKELAVEVLSLSGGLPIAVRAIVEKVDPVVFAVPHRIEADVGLGWLPGEFDSRTQEVAAAAAVLGMRFGVDQVVDIGDLAEVDVLTALDRLVEVGLVYLDLSERHDSVYSFHHVLTRQAFLDLLPPFRSRQLHLAAADQAHDIHTRALYLARAGRPFDAAVAALKQSADEHFARQRWWAVTQDLRLAEQLGGGALDAERQVRFATALDMTGQDGSVLRRKAHAAAGAAGDWNLALRAAVSGLASAERPDGDPGRVELLEAIPTTELDPDDRFELAIQIARQRSLVGDPDTAQAQAAVALTLATTAKQRTQAHVVRWTARHHVDAEAVVFSDELLAQSEGSQRARLLQMQAISTLEAGDLALTQKLHDEFMTEARTLTDSLRIWHGMTFDSLLAFEAGQWMESDRLADEAHQYGLLHGHQEASSTRVGQVFMRYYAADRAGELLPFFGSLSANVARSALARAAQAVAEASAGDRDKAGKSAVDLVEDALARPRSSSPVVIGLLASLVADAGSEDLIARSREFLLRFSGRSIVVGFGIACMGPSWRYIAPLAGDETQKRRWLELAVTEARRLGLISWEASNLRLLSDLTGEDKLVTELETLTAGTDIFRL